MLWMQVCLLERDVAGDPRRGAHVQRSGEVAAGARTDGGRVHVGGTAEHGNARRDPEIRCGRWHDLTDGGDRRVQVREDAALQPGIGEQLVAVGDIVGIPIVGEPVQGDRVVGCGDPAGEHEVDVVLGLEERPGTVVDVRSLGSQPEDVGDRVLACAGRGAACDLDPLAGLAGVVSLELDRSTDQVGDVRGAPGVHPDDCVVDGSTVLADGDRARPLAGDTHRDDVGIRVRRHGASTGGCDGVPPLTRVLLGASTGGEDQVCRLELAADQGTVVADESNLRA